MYQHIAQNKRRTWLLLACFVALVAALDYVMARAFGQQSLTIPIMIFGFGYAALSYYFSANIALATSGARAVTKQQAPEVYRIVENLTIASGLPMPKIYMIDDPSPNAFATGRDPHHAAVAVTSGIVRLLDKPELEGVLAHELSHVGNYDIRYMGLVMALVSVVSLIADLFLRISFWAGDDDNGGAGGQLFFVLGIVGALLAPLVAAVIQMAVSRQREYLADASGALLTRYPDGLARALEKIGAYAEQRPLAHANSATAPLYIANPLSGKFFAHMFDTHPPMAERTARLRQMEDRHGV